MMLKVFISKRSAADEFLRALIPELRADQIEVLSQDGIRGDVDLGAVKFIGESDLAIGVFAPAPDCRGLFDRDGIENASKQLGELASINRRIMHEGRENFDLLAVLLKEDGQRPTVEALRSALICVPEAEWLSNWGFLEAYPEKNTSRNPWLGAARRIANEIKRRGNQLNASANVEKARGPSDPGNLADPEPVSSLSQHEADVPPGRAQRKPEATVALVDEPLDEELRYLRDAAHAWSHGTTTNYDRSVGHSVESMFGFEPSRFLELGGETKPVVRKGVVRPSIREASASRWLFETSDEPVMLVGRSGAGKTTTITAAALAYAGPWDEAIRRKAERYDRSRASLPIDLRRIPVVLRAPDVAGCRGGPGTAETLKEAIGYAILGPACSPLEATAFADQRLRSIPYAIFIDGLDEIAAEEQQEAVVSAAGNLFDEMVAGPASLFPLIVLTTRSGRFQQLPMTEVVIEPADAEQIDLFVRQFAGHDEGRRRRLEKGIHRLRDSGGATLVSTPLFLNAYCELASRTLGFGASHVMLLKKSIEHMTDLGGVSSGEGQPVDRETVSRVLQNLAASIQDEGLAQEWFPAETAIEFIRASLGGPTTSVDRHSAVEFLKSLVEKTGLLVIREGEDGADCRFALSLSREYLAAEIYLSRWRETGGVAWTSIPRVWRASVVIAAALLADEDSGRAIALLHGLVERAELSDGQIAADWLCVATEALQECAFSERTLDTEPLLALLARMLKVTQGRRTQWPSAIERDRLLKGIYRFAIRSGKAARTDALLESLLDSGLEARTRWVEIPEPREVRSPTCLADTAVTVAAHWRFLQAVHSGEVSNACWSHAPSNSPHNAWSPDDVAVKRQMESPAAPVTSVTWFEAVAHARWLTEARRMSKQLAEDEVIRLPTRSEWRTLIKAFAAGHRYPWGDDVLAEGSGARVNWLLDCGLDWPSIPGVFDPYGLPRLYDFGATVRCWLIPDRDETVWPPRLESGEQPRIAGGSWACPENHFAAASPGEPLRPDARDNCVGYRFVRAAGTQTFISGGDS